MERLAVEANGVRLDEQRFPGRQGRILFAYLVVQKGRPVPRDELAQLLWGDELPATWEKALRVLMTKLRALLDESGIDAASALTSAFGCYQLTLPHGAWIDVEAAAGALERAEVALASGKLDDACAQAAMAAELARRSFLPGEDGPWVEEQRRDLRDLLVRALECLRDASLGAGKLADAVRHAAEITELEPFRESSYRHLMEAHVAAGDPAEALRVYERCRRFLGEELGAYPSPETEAVYLELLRSSPRSALVDAGHLEADDVLGVGSRPRRHRRLAVAGAGVVLVCAAAAAIAMTRGNPPPPEVLPTSLVRLDPKTLEPTKVVRIGPRADFVVVAGGYVWFTQGILRYGAGGIRNAGDRALTRVDPATGKATPVAGGVAPCGITPDPSGDMWVLNCYASGQSTNVQRINHRTLEFEPTYKIADGGFVRGMTYGGGWLWLNGKEDAARVIKLNPRTGRPRTIALPNPASGLAWSGSYGDLWIGDFGDNGVRGSVSRMPVETERAIKYPYYLGDGPAALLVQGDSVWVADWNNPFVVRVPAFGSGPPRYYRLKVRAVPAGVTALAAGFGAVWATVPDDRAVWRIDEETGERTRIPLRYYPWGVAAADDGIWVSLRARDA